MSDPTRFGPALRQPLFSALLLSEMSLSSEDSSCLRIWHLASGIWHSVVAQGHTEFSCAVLVASLLVLAAPCCAGEKAERKPAILCWTGLSEGPLTKAIQSAGFCIAKSPMSGWRWDYLRQFNVVVISGPEAISEAPGILAANLKKLVEQGGSLIVSPNGYWATDVWVGQYNSFFGPLFGLEWVGEHPWDIQHEVPGSSSPWGTVFWTDHFAPPHPLTAHLKRLYFTVARMTDGGSPCPLWKELPGWQTLVRGTGAAVSYPTTGQGYEHKQTGSYKGAPPLFSIKQVGKGYVALDALITSPAGERIMNEGDGTVPDDLREFAVGVLRWLAEPSKGSPQLGGYEAPKDVVMPARPAQSPETPWCFFRNVRLPRIEPPVTKVLIGIHSSLTDGRGTPEAMIASAKKAGYGAAFFAEAMPLMSQEKYEKLQALCTAGSGPDFAAFPGVQWQDEGGTEYLMLAIPRWPGKWIDPATKRMTDKWDVWFQNGHFPSIPLWLRAESALPHPWFYSHISALPVYSYRGNQLVENNEDWFLYLNEDRLFQAPVCVRLVYSPEEILAGAREGYQTYIQGPPESAVGALRHSMSNPRRSFVSSGPLLTRFTSVGREPFDVRVSDRWAEGFTLVSAEPLRRVEVRDRERTEYVLSGEGKRRFEFSFTGYHGRNHSFIVVAEDEKGGRLVGPAATTFCMSFGIWQSCSDQQNVIGTPWLFFKGQYNWIRVPNPLTVWRRFRDVGRPVGAPADGTFGDDNHWMGADLGIGKPPRPLLGGVLPIHSLAVRFHGGVVGRDLVRVDMTCDLLKTGQKGYHCDLKPRTDSAGEVRLYLFRPQETWIGNTLNYGATSSYLNPTSKAYAVMVEGTATAKQDAAAEPGESLYVGFVACGSGYSPAWQRQDGYLAAYLDPSGKAVTWTAPDKGGRLEGQVRKGGYLYVLPLHTGALGFYPLDRDMAFVLEHDGRYNWQLRLGLKPAGRLVKAGTSFSARFVIARTDQGYSKEQARACLDNVRREFGLGERQPAFVIKPSAGTIKGQQFLQEVEVERGGFRGTLYSPILSWPCIPLVITGLNDNWDAAVYGDNEVRLRRIPVRDGAGYASLDPIRADCREIWAGHPVLCNQPEARVLVLENGPAVCEVQVHNPTDQAMSVRLRPCPSARDLRIVPDFSRSLRVPPHGMERVRIEKGPVAAPAYQDIFYAIDHVMAQGRIVQDLDATWLEAARASDKAGLMVAAAGQVRKDWESYGPIGTDEPAGPMEMAVRMKLAGSADGDKPVARLVAVCGDGPGSSDDAGKVLCNEKEVASREVRVSEFARPNAYQEVVLRFERPKEGWMGYHVEWLGGPYIHVDTITVRQPPE